MQIQALSIKHFQCGSWIKWLLSSACPCRVFSFFWFGQLQPLFRQSFSVFSCIKHSTQKIDPNKQYFRFCNPRKGKLMSVLTERLLNTLFSLLNMQGPEYCRRFSFRLKVIKARYLEVVIYCLGTYCCKSVYAGLSLLPRFHGNHAACQQIRKKEAWGTQKLVNNVKSYIFLSLILTQ